MQASLYSLRQTAKEILAAAVLEVFPGTQLIEGEVSDIGFHYDFLFSPNTVHRFGERELARIEDHMRLIAYEKRPISQIEMMRENAQIFFDHLGQRVRADTIGEIPSNVINIFKMGEFHDACIGPFLEDSSLLSIFKLIESETEGERVRISGSAFFDKDSLKEFIKKFKEAKKKDYKQIGPKLGLFITKEGSRIYLPKGEALRKSLLDKWREMHVQMNFHFIHTSIKEDQKNLHKWIFESEHPPCPYRIAQLMEDSDFASIFCKEDQLLSEMISSLQFINQTIKIFGFERRVYLLSPSSGKSKKFTLLLEAVKQAGIIVEDQSHENFSQDLRLEFHLVDNYGRGWKGPFIALDGEKPILYRSLFGSIDRWIALLVEKKEG